MVGVYRNENDKDSKKFFKIDEKIPFENIKTEELARLITHEGKFGDSDIMDLWQVDIDKSKLLIILKKILKTLEVCL